MICEKMKLNERHQTSRKKTVIVMKLSVPKKHLKKLERAIDVFVRFISLKKRGRKLYYAESSLLK